MAWVGRLIDVAPDGSARLITQGWLRASFRYVDPSALARRARRTCPTTATRRSTIGADDRVPDGHLGHRVHAGARATGCGCGSAPPTRPTHEPLPVAGRNLILHDADHPSQLILGTGSDAVPRIAPPYKAKACTKRKRFAVPLRKDLRKLRVTVGGRRARVTRRGHSRVVMISPRGSATSVLVRVRGVDRHGRRVSLKHRYSLCR